MSTHQWPRQEIAEDAERMYVRENLTASQIAARLHVSESTVRQALRSRDVQMRPAGRHGRRVVPAGKRMLALTMYEGGMTYQEVADQLGRPMTTIHRWCSIAREERKANNIVVKNLKID